MPFAVLHQRSENIDLFPGESFKDKVHDLFFGVLHHRFAREIAHGCGHVGIEQTQEVVDLGCGADGASRIAVNGLLLDGDHGRQS